VAFSPSPDEWDLDRLQRLVSENDLERGRIEYKRELGNGHKTLEAIAALANSFGGVVLIGIDETKNGPDRLTGVGAGERDRLISLCWSQLVPPFSPEVIPVKLGQPGKFVSAVLIESDYARRPVMLTQGNKVLVRLEDKNMAPAPLHRIRCHPAGPQPAQRRQPGAGSAELAHQAMCRQRLPGRRAGASTPRAS